MKNEALGVWTARFLGALIDGGVEDFVVCPGSRSTPLVLGLEKRDNVRVTSVVDERSAAFFALGRARITGRATAVICTSGTAGAHFYPAVLEAEASQLPLLVITADRPFELVDTSAPQTMDQRALFGAHVRAEVELGVPEAHPTALDGAARAARRAVLATTSPVAGPVHINFRARKPLEIDVPDVDAGPVVYAPRCVAADEAVQAAAARIAAAERPVIVAGVGATEAVFELGARIGAPVVADVASGLRNDRAIVHGAAFVHTEALPAPDLVVRVGAPPTATAWRTFFGRRPPTVVFAANGLPDPFFCAELFVLGDVDDAVTRVVERVERRDAGGHLAEWRAADEAAAARIETLGWSEATATRAFVRALPDSAIVVAGNSLAVRNLDLFAPPTRHRVLSQRGVNGIDGLIAGAAGAADAAHAPVGLLLGDVSFLHDVGSLAVARSISGPLAIVVLDNGGGRIFEHLPLAGSGASEETMARFVTPPALDVAAAASAFGVGYAAAEDEGSVERMVREAFERTGTTVVHVRCPPDGAKKAQKEVSV